MEIIITEIDVEEKTRIIRKKIFNIVFFLLLLSEATFLFQPDAYGDATNCPDGMVGYWKLDEAASSVYLDEIIDNIGTCMTGCPVSGLGVFGNAQRFDGAQSIDVAADSAFNWPASQNFTVELWVSRSTEGFSDDFEALVGRSDGSLQWYVGINSNGQAQTLLKASDGSGPPAPMIAGIVAKDLRNPSETWHHVALVRDAGQGGTFLYVDGELAASQQFTYSTGFASETAPITLGALNGDRFFNGGLDEVAIYDRALSENEIKSHYYVPRSYCARYNSPVSIMPLGDSITLGIWDSPQPPIGLRIAYRYDLWQLLGSNMFWLDYIGSQYAGYDHDESFDADHAGFGGITDDELYSLLATGINPVTSEDLTGGEPYLNSYPAEVVLLHIGTNDLDADPSDVENILDQIDAFSRNVTVLLAKIINQVPLNGTVTDFNAAIETMVSSRVAQGDKIILVDMESGASLNYVLDTTDPYTSGDMYDDLHPNPSGYNKMALKWFETLDTILPQSDLPLFISPDLVYAIRGEDFSYAVAAVGPPRPTFSIGDDAPDGMTIDAFTGEIQWAPDTVGDYRFTVTAENWTGTTRQDLTVSVNVIPEAVADQYSGIQQGSTLTVSADQGVLANDSDENDAILSAILADDVSHGMLDLNADGSFTYTHDGSKNFSDGFTYKASDGKAESDPVAVTLAISPSGGGGGGGGGGCFIATLLMSFSLR